MVIVKIIIVGYVVLVAAIIANGLASKLGLVSWYELLTNHVKPSFVSIVWLFVGYPILLGSCAYGALKVLR